MINKQVLPESFDFGMPSVELIGVGSKGLDKTAMVKRASAFDDVLDKIEKKANRTYLHVITTGAFEKYGANANCLTADTQVVTDKGMKNICEIQIGDRVLTHDGSYRPVVDVMSRMYTGQLISIKAQGLPKAVQMTAEHPVHVVRASDMQYHYGRLHNGRESKEDMACNLDKHLASETGFQVAEEIDVGSSVYVPAAKVTYGLRDVPHAEFDMLHAKPYLVDEYSLLTAYIFGLWVAEGCVSIRKKDPCKQKRRTSANVKSALSIWTLNTENDSASATLLYDFAERFGFSLHHQTQGAVTHVRLGGTKLAHRLTQLFGSGAKHKFIHSAILGMPEEWRLAFIGGYLDGDGSECDHGKSKGTIIASTVSSSLAFGIQQILMSLGRKASVALTHNYVRNGCFGSSDGEIYQIAICAGQSKGLTKYCKRLIGYSDVEMDYSKNLFLHNKLFTKVTGVESNYVENIPVYNLEVEENHTFCVPFVVHNCDAYNGHSFEHTAPYPEDGAPATITWDGGLSKYHDDTYMKDGAVYQEHQTKTAGVQPSGEIIAARYNTDMERGELVIAVDTVKWHDRLQKKASGHDIYLSIGCSVPADYCMVCHHKARVSNEHCTHFKHDRGKLFKDGSVACVMNDTPSFYDISGVNVPADKIAFVLRKMASVPGTMEKEASLEALTAVGTRRPMLFTKAAAILSKLAEMEKQVQGLIEGDKEIDLEAFRDDDDEKKNLILRVESYPTDEVIDSCNRKGILLSPGMLFKLLGSDLEDGNLLSQCDDDSCGDMSCMMRELEEDEDVNDELMDGSFDQHFPADLNLDDILNKFLPEFGTDNQAIQAKVIRITISPRQKKGQEKKASFNKQAELALRKTYARYLVSFAERNSDQACLNALMKIAAIGK